MNWIEQSRQALDGGKTCILVTVLNIRGSAPREAGVKMAVCDNGICGTIGGGTLELRAIAYARTMIADGNLNPATEQWILGPDLGQCCGGKVDVSFEHLDGAVMRQLTQELDDKRNTLPQVAIFGAGHVGLALIGALSPLPFQIICVDDRKGRIPERSDSVEPVLSEHPEREVEALPSGSMVFVMSYSHDLDYKICHAALQRDDLPFVGLIGSATKRARFLQRIKTGGLPDAALLRFVCPIGIDGIAGKSPAVIAASAAAQLLRFVEAAEAMKQDSTPAPLHVVEAGK